MFPAKARGFPCQEPGQTDERCLPIVIGSVACAPARVEGLPPVTQAA